MPEPNSSYSAWGRTPAHLGGASASPMPAVPHMGQGRGTDDAWGDVRQQRARGRPSQRTANLTDRGPRERFDVAGNRCNASPGLILTMVCSRPPRAPDASATTVSNATYSTSTRSLQAGCFSNAVVDAFQGRKKALVGFVREHGRGRRDHSAWARSHPSPRSRERRRPSRRRTGLRRVVPPGHERPVPARSRAGEADV